MNIWLIAFTRQGATLCARLKTILSGLGHKAEGFSKYETVGTNHFTGTLKDFTQKAFAGCDGIIFVGAAGIAVRAISPFISSKNRDPAVIVIDEKGKYVIPVLSGHIGGANELAMVVARELKAEAVITTATDINNAFVVDTWAISNSCHIVNTEKIKYISAAILNSEPVGFYSEFPIEGNLPHGLSMAKARVGICVSSEHKNIYEHTLHILPKQYILGIGCRKNTDYEELSGFVTEVLLAAGIQHYEIGGIASIDIKRKEEALISLGRNWRIPFQTFSAEELSGVSGFFSSSAFVKETTGVDNVCERAAVIAAQGKLFLKKTCGNGITVAIAKKDWRCRF